jgi:hypothetical protein
MIMAWLLQFNDDREHSGYHSFLYDSVQFETVSWEVGASKLACEELLCNSSSFMLMTGMSLRGKSWKSSGHLACVLERWQGRWRRKTSHREKGGVQGKAWGPLKIWLVESVELGFGGVMDYVAFLRATLFILFSVASQIRLLPETHNYTKQIFVHNWCELQWVHWNAVCWIELELRKFLCWNHIIVWFPEIKEATLNTIIPNNIRVSISISHTK